MHEKETIILSPITITVMFTIKAYFRKQVICTDIFENRVDTPRHGVLVRASALRLVDLRFIPQVNSYQKTLKNGVHSFPAWRLAHRDSVEKKPASLLVVGKALNGFVVACWQGT